jgi:hypothetical protein
MAEMSPLRRRMIEDMTIRNPSPATQQIGASWRHVAVSRLTDTFFAGRSALPSKQFALTPQFVDRFVRDRRY